MADGRKFRRIALIASFAFAAFSGPRLGASDLAWQSFEDGRQAFDERRFDVALTDWQVAVVQRKDRFIKVSSAIEAALVLPEASYVWDKIDTLVERLGTKEFGAREFDAIRDAAAGSLRRQMEDIHRRTKSPELANFTFAWLAVEDLRGATAIHNSLKALQSLALALQSYPEAEFGIGKVFFIEGELGLAQIQYRKAIAAAASLEVPDDRLEMVMALSAVHRAQGDWKGYEEDLRVALSDSVIFSQQSDFLRAAMERALDLEGFDAMARLYPLDEPKIVTPAASLGEFLLRNWRSQATISLALAADAMVTGIMGRIRKNEPSADSMSIPELGERIAKDRELTAWCDALGFWKYLYYLGESLLAESRLQAGRQLLQEIGASQGSGSWGSAAKLALSRPNGTRPAILP